jgi:uncharacterized protein (DUF302 family)
MVELPHTGRLHSEDFIGAKDGGVTNYAIRGMSGRDHRLTMRTLEPFKSPKEQRVRNMRVSDASEVMTKSSPYSVAETVARFNDLVVAKDMKVFAVINHSDEAHEAGLDLPETKVIIFGNPEAGTPVMEAAPLVALELPLKVLIWEDKGRTRVSYTAPGALAERYGLCADVARMLDGIEPLTDAVIMYTNDTFGVTV